jgi:hypothetical protein
MAIFGNNATQGLAIKVSEDGAQATAGKLNAVASAADRVGRSASSGAAAGIGRLRQGLNGLRGMATGLLGTFARVGGMLGLGGAFAVGGLIRDSLDASRALHQIAFQGGLGADAMERMRRAAQGISGETGKSRAEILTAIAAAEDMGLSFEQAQNSMKDIVLWSDLLGVSADQASGAVGAINKALGGNGDITQIMAMLNAGAAGAGMDEGQLFGIIKKVAPQLQGVEGVGDITSFLQTIAGLGEEFAGDPRQIASGFKAINKTLNDPKLRKTFERFGIQGDNASEVLISMAQKLAGDAHSLDRANLPDEIMLLASTIAGNLDKVNEMGTAVQNAAGNTEDFARRISEHAKDPEVAWAATMEKLKIAMQPLVEGLLGWVLANKDALIEGVQQFATGLAEIVRWIVDLVRGPATGTVRGGWSGVGERVRARREAATAAAQGEALGQSLASPYSYFVPGAVAAAGGGAGGPGMAPGQSPVGPRFFSQPPVNVNITNNSNARVDVDRAGRSVPTFGGGSPLASAISEAMAGA